MKYFLASILVLAISLNSCRFISGETVSGNHHVISQQKDIHGFNAIRVSGSMDVSLRQDPETSVKVVTDENLMSYVDIYKDGNTLVIREKDGYNLKPSKDLIVYVTAATLKDITISGSGNLRGGNEWTQNQSLDLEVSGSGNIEMQANVPSLQAKISGSGSASLKGKTQDFDGSISGSGGMDCLDLESDNVTISVSGSGSAEVTANNKLDVNVSGSGSVTYKGNATVSQTILGSGEVKKLK